MLVLKWHSLDFVLESREKNREVVTRLSLHGLLVGHQAARAREQGPIDSDNLLGRGFRLHAVLEWAKLCPWAGGSSPICLLPLHLFGFAPWLRVVQAPREH